MIYKCPYCHVKFAEIPKDGHCGTCGRVMRVPTRSTPEERASRRRKIERMAFEAERHIAEIRHGPDTRVLYSPKVLFGFLLAFAIVGALLVRKADPLARARPELPQKVALRQLDTLATALGRYRFHVGEYPANVAGLQALLNNPGVEGWDGPYINQLRPDPWGTAYQYLWITNGVVRLFTCGPDRLPRTPDDLRPDPDAFDPGTAWTNGWVSAIDRQPGVLVLRQDWTEAPGPSAP